MMKFLLGVAAAFVLVAASPASACEDCKNCQHHKKESAQVEKTGAVVADAEKKDEKKACKCTDHKTCACKENCGCAACKMKAEKKEEPKKS